MAITLARIDDRLIHGQTTTRWSKERPVDGIIIVGDEVVSDELRMKVLRSAAGKLKLGIYSLEQGPKKIEQAKESSKNFFLITSSPQVYSELLDLGADFGNVLNVGPMNTREGATVVGRTLALDEADYNAFENINSKGIDIQFQLLPDNPVKKWDEIKNTFNSKNN